MVLHILTVVWDSTEKPVYPDESREQVSEELLELCYSAELRLSYQ